MHRGVSNHALSDHAVKAHPLCHTSCGLAPTHKKMACVDILSQAGKVPECGVLLHFKRNVFAFHLFDLLLWP